MNTGTMIYLRSEQAQYRGIRTPKGCRIRREDPDGSITQLPPGPSRRLRDHSPTGFEWGYGGSGPAQTALALLLDFTGDANLAQSLYQDFKWRIISRFADEWELTGAQIKEAIATLLATRRQEPAQ